VAVLHHPKDALQDGEVVHEEPNGVTSFAALAIDLSEGRTEHLVYYIFDLLRAVRRLCVDDVAFGGNLHILETRVHERLTKLLLRVERHLRVVR
jgi:hypothetical protein